MPTYKKEIFQVQEYNVSIDKCCWIACCPIVHYGFCPYKTILVLEAEEAVKTDTTICGTNKSRRPYGELGNVDRGNCCCFVSVSSALGPISPGCGCNGEMVDTIVEELKARMKKRGDTGQIQRAEQQIEKLESLEAKVDLILNHLNIAPPAAESMERNSLLA